MNACVFQNSVLHWYIWCFLLLNRCVLYWGMWVSYWQCWTTSWMEKVMLNWLQLR